MKIQQENGIKYSAQQSGQEDGDIRTFVFQSEQTHQSLIKDIKVKTNTQTIDLTFLFKLHCPLEENEVSIYHPEANKFVPLSRVAEQANGLVPRALLQTRVIMIRFRRRGQDYNSGTDSGVQSGVDSSKGNDRSRERTIGESIELVKKWRFIQIENIRLGLKRMSLADAAKAIGVSKKSLDDYYYQLRLGEFYNFDFVNNLDQKIGILRAYVKQFKPERQQRNKYIRHPKSLKIIEQFEKKAPHSLKQMHETPPQVFQPKSPDSLPSLSVDGESEPNFGDNHPSIKNVMQSYENNFFKNFEFMLDDPFDPFVQIHHNFKKKAPQQPGDDFFFF